MRDENPREQTHAPSPQRQRETVDQRALAATVRPYEDDGTTRRTEVQVGRFDPSKALNANPSYSHAPDATRGRQTCVAELRADDNRGAASGDGLPMQARFPALARS